MSLKSQFGFHQMIYGKGMDNDEPMMYIVADSRDAAKAQLPALSSDRYWQFICQSTIREH